jgi:hypothetical protein
MATGLSLFGDGEDSSLFLTKEEAMETEVLPRSLGLSPQSRTALSVPSSSASIPKEAAPSQQSNLVTMDELLGSSSRPASPSTSVPSSATEKPSQEFVSLEELLGAPTQAATTVPAAPKAESGDTSRGFTTALEQTPALAFGALGFAGAAGEKAFGTGGAMTSLKNFGLSEYGRRMKEIGETAKDTDDVTKAWAKAQQGDLGALVDWAQYGVGYLGGNIVETVATSALGSLAGGLTAGPVGAVAGAGAGVAGKEAVKGVTKNLIEGMVAKEAAKLAEKEGIEFATDQMLKQATKTVAKNIGAGTALVGSGIIKSTGGIYGEAEAVAGKEGRELTGGDLARIFGSGVVAGLSEAVVDRLGLDVAAGKINIPGAGRPGRALIGGAAGVGIEGGQELFQTAIERFGAGKDLAGEDAMNEYINAFALGGLGGGTIGAAVGAFRDGKTDAGRVKQILDQAQTDLTSDDGRQELFESMSSDEKIAPILQANGIESGDDPRFQNVLIKALSTQRMLVDLEAPTPEVMAETRKQREADVLAAFGEAAPTETAVSAEPAITEQAPVVTAPVATEAAPVVTTPPVNEAGFIPEPPAQVAAQVAAVRDGSKTVAVTTKADLKGVSTKGLTRVTVKDPETNVESVLVSKDKTIGAKAQKLIADIGFKPAMGQLLGYVEPTATTTPPADAVVVQQKDAAGNIVQEEIVPAARAGEVKRIEGTTPTVTTVAVASAERQVQAQGEPDATQVRQVTEGDQQQRQGTGGQVPAVGEDRGVQTQKQKGGGKAGRGDQPVQGGTQPQAAVTEEADRNEAVKVAKGNFETAIDQVNDPAYNGDIDLAFEAYRQNTADTLDEQGKKGSIDYADREFSRLVKEYKSKQPKPAPAPVEAAKPAIDPVVQARVKERINKAYEDGALDIEDVVALTEMADQGNLMGAITQMKKTAEANKGAGAGAKYSLSRTPAEPATTTRDFAYAKLKTVDDLNKEVRGHLARQGSTDTFTAKRVPVGDLAGKIPGVPAMQRIADLFRKKLVYFAVAEGSIDFLDGAVLSGSDTIFVNINSSRPHVRILGHEMVHALRFSDPKLYARLVTHLTPYLDQAGMSRYRQIMAQEGMKDPALILEEAIADIVGDRFGESAFWQMMADENPTMFQQLARVVIDFLDSVMAKLRSSQTLDSKNLLTDVGAARQAVASVLATFEQQQAQPQPAVEAQPVAEAQPAPTEEPAPAMFSRAKEGEIFYSALERAFVNPKISLDKNGATTGQQWKAWLESNRSNIGVKKEEIEYVGINDWLSLNEKEKLTPDQVRTWVIANKVGINDVLLTSDRPDGAPVAEFREPTADDMREFIDEWIAENQFEDNIGDVDESIFETGADDMTELEMRQWITDNFGWQNFLHKHRRLMERFQRGRVTNMLRPKHGDDWLVLPGGKNYVELILFDPTIAKYKEDDDVHFGDVSQGRAIGWLRMNQRKDKDGNDVLFIEEIQSQRAQEGRKRGFANKTDSALSARAASLKKEAESLEDRLDDIVIDIENMREDREAYEDMDDDVFEATISGFEKEAQEKEARLFEVENELSTLPAIGEVPMAPFVEKTESWTALLLKRAMAYAQTVGIDTVVWTTGEQQNERYQFKGDELAYVKDNNTNTYTLTIKKKGTPDRSAPGISEKDLPDYVGDKVAERILEGKGAKRSKKYNTVSGSFTGEEMKLMTANLRPYYNQTLPSVAKDVMKSLKADGKVEVFDIESTGQQLGFVIPESVQEQVANDGFPMFSRKKYEDQFSDVSPDTRERALKKGFYSPPTIKERLEQIKPNFWMRIVQGTFDKFRSVREISNKAYIMLRMSTGSQDGAVSTLLHYGQVFNDDGALNVKKGTQGLLEILDPVGGEVDRFLLWIAANRAASLSKDERERFFSPEDIKALRALNLGKMKDGKSRVGVYAETLKNMNELNRSVLDVARDTGLIDAEGYKRFSADIWYIPFYRQMEDDGSLSAAQTSSGSVGQYLSKKLKGSDRPLNDLMENVLMNWTHILSASMKNQAAVETLTAATEMGDIVTKLDAQEKGAVKVMIKGQETYYRIDDEFLLTSLSAISQMPDYGWGMDILRGFKTTLTRFISLSPTFKINNLIRDSIQSIGLSELSRNPVGNVMQGWRAYMTDRAEALAGGGLFAMGNAFDGDQSASIKRILKTGVSKADILDTPDKVANFFRSVQDKYDVISDASENANRLALYQQLRASGASHLEASYAARDLQDFGLQGSWAAIRYAAQVLPYFNARLQGMYKLGRDGIDPTMQVLTGNASDTERQKAAKFATVTGAVVAAAFILYLSQKDDEDWKKREDWDRDAFFWFKIPGTNKAVRIPKPFEMGAIATIFERALEQMVDSGVEGKVFAKRLGAVLHDTFAINPIPQAIRPLYDIARNKDGFTDRPIESMGMERISPQLRKSPGTSAAAVSLNTVNNMFAQFASTATGGAIKPESVQFSAIQYDYMLKGYLGWVGAGIQTASNMMAAPFKDGASPRYERIDDFLVVGNYVKSVPQAQSRYVTSFYENSKDIATAASDVSHFLNAGQLERANELFTEKQDKLALVKLYNKGTNMMSGISSQIRMIEDDKEMSGAEKRLEIERLQQIRIDIAKQVEEIRINQKK